MGPVRQAISDAGLQASELSKVLLVGGSTRIPAVQEAVKGITGREGFKGINPDECVAVGASIQGGVLGGDVKGLLLLDVTPLCLGRETMGGVFTKLIERSTTRRGVPQIEVTFDIDANGIVNVSAKDLGTGKEQNITITASSNLSKEDIDKAVQEAAQYAAEDAKRKEDVDTRNQADQMIYQCDQAVSELGDKISAAEKSNIEAAKTKLQDAMKGTDTAAIKAATEELTKVFYDISAKLYQQAAPQDGNPTGGADAGSNGGQEYYDADYQVVDDDNN